MDRAVRGVLLSALVTLTACGSSAEPLAASTQSEAPATVAARATATVDPSLTAAASPTSSVVAIESPAASPSSPPAPTPGPQATTRPPTPTPSPALTPVPTRTPPTGSPVATASGSPAQTRVPDSYAIPSPNGLPATDGCLTYGAQPPYITFVDCVVHGLPLNAPVTLTANGEVQFLRIGRTDVYPDGTWYFAWYEPQHKEIIFVVTAGGVSRTITQVFR
jgi:hypothetical protein